MKRIAMLLGAGLLILCSMVWAAVPQLINFQGILRDGSGNPVANGPYSVTFTIYDAPSAGTNLWQETQSVNTINGLFTVLLGSGPIPLDYSIFNDSTRWLGVKVGADPEMTPRQRLSSVGYSHNSAEWTSAAQDLFRLNGNVGIGTSSPGAKLDIQTGDSYGVKALGGTYGVYGEGGTYGNFGFSPAGTGVYGRSFSGTGVYAYNNTGTGVYAFSNTGSGVDASGGTNGVITYGGAMGVYAFGGSYGVFSTSSSGTGVYASSNSGYGVNGNSPSGTGVVGTSSTSTGVSGVSTSGYGVYASGGPNGVVAYANNAGGAAVYGDNLSSDDYGGYFVGNVVVTGTLFKGGLAFKIDHPLDPSNKYLNHSGVESPDMKNIYDGVVTTDAKGNATVSLAEWFGALNRDFRYQLTAIGQFAQAIVSKEIANNQFSIQTDKPNVKVSWQVTGIRKDAYAEAHRIPVEEAKSGKELGKYLHPKENGAPVSLGMHYEQEQKMAAERKQMEEQQTKMEAERKLHEEERAKMEQERLIQVQKVKENQPNR